MACRATTRVLHAALAFVCASMASIASLPRARADAALALAVSAPDACADGSAVSRRIAELIGRALPNEGDDLLRANVRIEGAARAFQVEIETDRAGAKGSRTVRGASCSEVAEAAAIVIAVSLEPGLASLAANLDAPAPSETSVPAQNTASEPVAAKAPPAADPPPARAEPKAEPAAPPRPRRAYAVVRAGALLDTGSLPKLALGPAGAIGMRAERLELSGFGYWLSPRSGDRDDSGRQVRASQWAGGLTGCMRAVGRRVSLWPCASFEGGRASADAAGVLERQRGHSSWLAPGLDARLTATIVQRFELFLSAGAAFALVRPRFVVEDQNGEVLARLHRADLVTGRFGAGLQALF